MYNFKHVIGNILSKNTPIVNANETDDLNGLGVIVCHQVNCQGVMGAGLAKQVREEMPGVFASYKDKCLQIKAGIGGLGDVQFCCVISEKGYIVANIFGQYYYGRDRQHTDYKALREAFSTIAQAFPNYTIRIPYKMGCGLGGGKWDVVCGIIETELVSKGVNVEIWQKV